MKELITSSEMFGIFLSLATYTFGLWVKKKWNTPVANPLLIAIVLCVAVLVIFDIPYANFNAGGAAVTSLLVPATAVLGISIYRELETLKKNFLPVMVGCIVGSIVSVVLSIVFCKLFGLDDQLVATMIPRAATSPIAMEVAENLGGLVPVTVAVVVFSGIVGAVAAPIFISVMKWRNRVAVGVAIGVSSSAAGTSRAIEIGEVEGAMSGLAMGITGLATVVIGLFL